MGGVLGAGVSRCVTIVLTTSAAVVVAVRDESYHSLNSSGNRHAIAAPETASTIEATRIAATTIFMTTATRY